ncbi:MAG TPA: cyclase family protein [Bacteroidales bacterium]|nr:MAG: Kynurenine formamidase [Bacteroidetes bacterium ADurb.Bin037]HPV88308.1 cyclase family protein [Bacteroidales bacterium]HPW78076.1 cyclase family protein [Bacteroidales bacterium]HQB56584.1 cyclase family protein [Bacteroidales bacterium]
MRIYDISQEIFSGAISKGDPVPAAAPLYRIKDGHPYNVSAVSMCLHSATHIDAPSHLIENGLTVDRIDLERCIGPCMVLTANGLIDEGFISPLLGRGAKRLLFKGKGWLSVKAAAALSQSEIVLIGTENQTVGHGVHEEQVHKVLLENNIVILEGLVLNEVPEGNYYLVSLPLKFGGMEGSPCRAVLLNYLPPVD